MTSTLPSEPGASALLLGSDGGWVALVRAAAAEAGIQALDVVATASAALDRLVDGRRRYSHLLLQPGLAGPMLGDLVGLTSGEAGSGIDLILLGERDGHAGGGLVTAPDAGALVDALRRRHRATRPVRLSVAGLRRALARGRLEARFQPIVRLSDRKPLGLEVLARLARPGHGTLPPGLFVQRLEDAGLSPQLTDAVAGAALSQAPLPLLARHGLVLTLNYPLDVLLVPEALARIEEQRRNAGIAAAQLVIELTESRPVTDLAALAIAMRRWGEAGYRLALDDVGPATPGWAALMRLPFSVVKLDQGIVADCEADEPARDFVRAVVSRSEEAGLLVVAEGVSDDATWARMAGLGAAAAQGFAIGRPLPAGAVEPWLRGWLGTA